MISKYKPVGWRNESHRHYLAAKGIKTKYFSPIISGKDIPTQEHRGTIAVDESKIGFEEQKDFANYVNKPWGDGVFWTSTVRPDGTTE